MNQPSSSPSIEPEDKEEINLSWKTFLKPISQEFIPNGMPQNKI